MHRKRSIFRRGEDRLATFDEGGKRFLGFGRSRLTAIDRLFVFNLGGKPPVSGVAQKTLRGGDGLRRQDGETGNLGGDHLHEVVLGDDR